MQCKGIIIAAAIDVANRLMDINRLRGGFIYPSALLKLISTIFEIPRTIVRSGRIAGKSDFLEEGFEHTPFNRRELSVRSAGQRSAAAPDNPL